MYHASRTLVVLGRGGGHEEGLLGVEEAAGLGEVGGGPRDDGEVAGLPRLVAVGVGWVGRVRVSVVG